jgi:hypothetical protein
MPGFKTPGDLCNIYIKLAYWKKKSVWQLDLTGKRCQNFLQIVKCFGGIFKNLNDSIMDMGWIGTLLLRAVQRDMGF